MSRLVQGVKTAIKNLIDDENFELLGVNDTRWWIKAVSAARVHLRYLHASPDKGRALIKYIADCSDLQDKDRNALVTKYLQRTKQCKTPRERLVIMKILLTYYRRGRNDASNHFKNAVKNIMRERRQQQRQEQKRMQLDVDRYCFLDERYTLEHGNMKLICAGEGYSIHLSENGNSSVILCDADVITLQSLFVSPELCNGNNNPRVFSEHKLPGTLSFSMDDIERGDEAGRIVNLLIITTEAIDTTLADLLTSSDVEKEEKVRVLDIVFEMTETMAQRNIQHGDVITQNILRSVHGWFIVDGRLLQKVRGGDYVQFNGGLPSVHVRSWDTITLCIDVHEKLNYSTEHRKEIMDVFYPKIKFYNDNARFEASTYSADESICKFRVSIGNSNVVIETLVVVINGAADTTVEWQRDMCVKTVIGEHAFYIPPAIFTERNIVIKEKLGSGVNSYVYVAGQDGSQVAKITDSKDEAAHVEHRLQSLAASYGYSPKVHDYFSIRSYAGMTVKRRSYINELVCVVMDRYDMTLYDYIDDAIYYAAETNFNEVKALLLKVFTMVRDFAGAGFMHRDLKGDNIVVRDDSAAIIDFGLARHVSIVNPIYDADRFTSDSTANATEDLTPNDPSWISLPPLCNSRIYDLISLYVAICYSVNTSWTTYTSPEQKKVIVALKDLLLTDILDVLQMASCASYDAYFERVFVNRDRKDVLISVTLVYVEKVKTRFYRTVIDTSLVNFANKRVRVH